MEKKEKVVLAYSGGLDTSVILKWLQEEYNCEVIAFTADIGQGEELNPAKVKAKKLGVNKIYIKDLREEFVKDFVFPMMRCNTLYEGEYLLGTAIARPLIAKHLVQIAKKEKAFAIAHGATGKGNDTAGLNDEQRAAWRKQSLTWLRDELRTATSLLKKRPQAARGVATAMHRLLSEPNLASVRDGAAIAMLPASDWPAAASRSG